MTKAKVTPIRHPQTVATRPLPPSQVIERRAHEANGELMRVSRMLQALRLLADSDVVGEDCLDEIDGIGEMLGDIIEAVFRVANQIDPVTLLSTEGQS